jgi:hypothetical protein
MASYIGAISVTAKGKYMKHRFLVKHKKLGWISVESDSPIPASNEAWKAKLADIVQTMELREKYEMKMEFEGEHLLVMIRPDLVDFDRPGKKYPNDYDPARGITGDSTRLLTDYEQPGPDRPIKLTTDVHGYTWRDKFQTEWNHGPDRAEMGPWINLSEALEV